MEPVYFGELLDFLKDGVVLCTKSNNRFVYKKDRVWCYFEGNAFPLSEEDFLELYKKEKFYVFEDSTNEIDEDKDYAYYRYYRK